MRERRQKRGLRELRWIVPMLDRRLCADELREKWRVWIGPARWRH
jgi:hypothetical protein